MVDVVMLSDTFVEELIAALREKEAAEESGMPLSEAVKERHLSLAVRLAQVKSRALEWR